MCWKIAAVGALGEPEEPGTRDEPRPGLLRAPRRGALCLDDVAGRASLLPAIAARQREQERLPQQGCRVRPPARSVISQRSEPSVVERLVRLEPEEGNRAPSIVSSCSMSMMSATLSVPHPILRLAACRTMSAALMAIFAPWSVIGPPSSLIALPPP